MLELVVVAAVAATAAVVHPTVVADPTALVVVAAAEVAAAAAAPTVLRWDPRTRVEARLHSDRHRPAGSWWWDRHRRVEVRCRRP